MQTTLQPILRATMALLIFSAASQAQIPDPPTPLAATAIGPDSFTANWEAVPGATSYRLDVMHNTPAPATDLFLSEYIEGTGSSRAIELYNGTGAPVDLASYTLRRQADGAGAFGADLTLSGILPNNTAYVIVYQSGNVTLEALADLITTHTAMVFTGNDAVALFKNGTEIDRVGVVNQAANWGADVTLVRKGTVTGPTVSYTIADWDSYPVNNSTHLKSHAITATVPSFVAGYEDLTVNGTSQLVTGLEVTTDYFYWVRAVNGDGTSANSTPTIQVTTLALTVPPIPLPGSAIGADLFTANWEAVADATSYRLDVSTSPTFGAPVVATDLIISEYIEGTAGYRAVEIYNGTGAAVTLSGVYRLRKQQDGAPGVFDTALMTGVLPHGSTWVATFSGPAAGIAAVANLTHISAGGPLDFDGNDAFSLMKNGVAIDAVGVMDQAAPWGADMTLRRKSSVTSPTTNYSINDWDAYPMNNIADTGSHTMITFIPSFLPGYEDLTVNGTSQLVSGLTPETDYYYRVRTVDADGTSVNSTPTIHVRTLALPAFGSIAQAPGIACEDTAAMFILGGLTPDSTNSIDYNIGGGPTQVATGVVADNSGNATFNVVLSLANDGQVLTVTAVERTDVPSVILPVTTNNTVVLDVTAATTYYADNDLDGYGDINNPVQLCQAIAGFVLDNTDCNDSNATINPGAPEIPFNGIDDNCDGNLDEGGQYISQVQSAICGTELSTINSYIVADYMPLASMYRFEVTDVETSAVEILDRTQNYIRPTMLSSYNYERAYSVRVMLQRNGVWLGYYGPACEVSTPVVLNQGGEATVNPSQCEAVLPTISTLIATTSLANVTGFRFRVTNAANPGEQQILDRGPFNWISLTMLSTFNYGATYFIEISVRANGTYSPYGSPCAVTAPPVPMLTNCGAVIASKGTLISVPSKDRVTAYRFRVTNLGTNEVTTFDRIQNWFSFNNIPGFTPGGLYSVQVAVMTTGVFSEFGDACEITAPAAARTNDDALSFSAVAYPNPFAENFNIRVTTTSEEDMAVRVYDMTGKLIEIRKASLLDMETLQVGDRYPAGVYNVVLTQGENVETLRVIKR